MADDNGTDDRKFLDDLLTIMLGLPWREAIRNAAGILRKVTQSRSYQGMYEVLEYESTLELTDPEGRQATFRKREKVRYLQDNVIAYQDQAWGDGMILLNYRCTPGTPVDQYRLGHKTYILISRREVKNKGDIDEFNVEWNIRQGFLRRTEQWETHVNHKTRHLEISVIYPKSRPPRRTALIESKRQRSRGLGKETRKLPDGRWQVTWETDRPRLYENYILQWQW